MELPDSGGLDNDTLYAETHHLVTNGNLEKLSLTKVVKLLEDSLGVSLKARIKFINNEITKIVQRMNSPAASETRQRVQTLRRPLRPRKRKRGTDDDNEVELSPKLQEFFGEESKNLKITRTEAIRRVWSYLKAENLHDSREPHKINVNQKLKKLFGMKEQITIFNFSGMIRDELKTKDHPPMASDT
mmetsp:Transcript_10146/g.13985  ORF Transcript_10146/g.13985 Transcript_10146/m.13985 type:complete len:187 (-) Transcript_10146:68-628(-)|eukprot:CAMPEP_0185265302 /NCGR_PEP_ID=MMETSP1359-20130426/27069_1 /TAXON_ID=552665 /ORGANISM="Bigelowiella longifila, Strain CCMP242" /LENGTH=186 /DNA_ID=CAMNT_0027854495 /DNA_START=61 /DNA_END=621 /DNA_ORIENTATION=-